MSTLNSLTTLHEYVSATPATPERRAANAAMYDNIVASDEAMLCGQNRSKL